MPNNDPWRASVAPVINQALEIQDIEEPSNEVSIYSINIIANTINDYRQFHWGSAYVQNQRKYMRLFRRSHGLSPLTAEVLLASGAPVGQLSIQKVYISQILMLQSRETEA